MSRRNAADFASEPDEQLSDGAPESPTRRLQKGKKNAAARRAPTAPKPPADPAPVMPRPKNAPAPSDRVTRRQVALGAAPAVPLIPLDASAPAPARQQGRKRPANVRRELDLGDDDDEHVFEDWWGIEKEGEQDNEGEEMQQEEEDEDEEDEGELEEQDDQEGGSDDPFNRSARYTRPTQADEVEDYYQGQKRTQSMRASVASRSDVPSPPRKKRTGASNVDAFAHFAPGRTADPYLSQIAECARLIITGGFKLYLPLHFFAPEIRRAEEEARLTLRPDETILARAPRPKVLESQASREQFMTWVQLALKAFHALHVPDMVINMYQKHWGHVQTAEDSESEWTTWRDYDLRRRAQVKGERPIDISELDLETLRLCRSATQAKINADMRAATLRYQERRPAAAQATSNNAQASTSGTAKTQALKVMKYLRCLICGSRTHTHDKDVSRDDCDATWLVRDERGTWKTPDTKSPICWMFNSVGGCSKSACRFSKQGHRCALCGGAHGCHSCPK
ncbi:hypothetical protein EXIGLDRAFT_692770 [Exidia glandulosa HHB12029]|uniref:Uncharacterized protein n=1 Tax=Exidia glandulosa HHB12029 TaxID=1314781 RepID=A0A165HQC1_EXIGL|nr:hypothetical protein EXIGLDRAFT_692770 [Exidia glandulosa HHB12029]